MEAKDFNLTAMKRLVDETPLLKSKFDILAVDGKDKYGYHWKEVVNNILYNKYVKLKDKYDDEAQEKYFKALFDRYTKYKKEIEEEKNRNKTETLKQMGKNINETMDSTSSGAFESPFAWSKKSKDKVYKNNIMEDNGFTMDSIEKIIESLDNLFEEMKPVGLIASDKIKDENEKEFKKSIKDLPDGIGEYTKKGLEFDKENEKPAIKYDYEKEKIDFPTTYEKAGEMNTDYVEDVARGLGDFKLDEPDKTHEDKLKQNLGDRNYKILKDRQRTYDALNKKAPMPVKVEVVKESFLYGGVRNIYNEREFKSVSFDKVTTIDSLNENHVPFEVNGYGNHGNIEGFKQLCEDYTFHYDKSDGTVGMKKKESINEGVVMLNKKELDKIKFLSEGVHYKKSFIDKSCF
jgi:uncharacterized protein YihD (DUF1040 family)